MKTLHVMSGIIVSTLLSHATTAAAEIAADHRGITYESSDKNLQLRAGGRVHLDAVAFDDDKTPLKDGSDFRRLRAYVAGKIYKDFSFKAEYEFTHPNEGWRNLWVRYSGLRHTRITLGNVSAPFSLENVTSSNNITFIERSLANAFVSRFYLGGMVDTYGKGWTAAGGVFREAIDVDNTGPNKGVSVVGRFTASPWRTKDTGIHLGISGAYQDLKTSSAYSASARPATSIVPTRLVRTGSLSDVDKTYTLGTEAAWNLNSILVQGEYITSAPQRNANPDPVFGGGYIQASWLVTGEKYRYNRKRGGFRGIKPKSAYGAIELAARYAAIDLQDETVTGGEQQDVTLGVNWYLNQNVRLMANYVFMDVSPNSSGVDETPQAALFRAQLDF